MIAALIGSAVGLLCGINLGWQFASCRRRAADAAKPYRTCGGPKHGLKGPYCGLCTLGSVGDWSTD